MKPYSYDNLPPVIEWWIDYLGKLAAHMAKQEHPLLKWLKQQNASKCESIGKK